MTPSVAIAGYEKAKETITDISILDDQVVSISDTPWNGTVDTVATGLLGHSLQSSRGIIDSFINWERLDWAHQDPDPFTITYRNDFDGPDYQDWVEGQTTITLNRRFLSCTNDIDSDTAKNLTEFKITFDTRVHSLNNAYLFVNGEKWWMGSSPFDNQQDLDEWTNEYGLRVMLSHVLLSLR